MLLFPSGRLFGSFASDAVASVRHVAVVGLFLLQIATVWAPLIAAFGAPPVFFHCVFCSHGFYRIIFDLSFLRSPFTKPGYDCWIRMALVFNANNFNFISDAYSDLGGMNCFRLQFLGYSSGIDDFCTYGALL